MGTTVTTNLGLIKPDTNESVKANLPTFAGWAAQNAANCDTVDALFRATTATPTLTFTAQGGGFTFGAGGGITVKSLRMMPRMVALHFVINIGAAGALPGTGAYQLTGMTPAVDPIFSQFTAVGGLPIGKAIWYDSSALVTSSVFEIIYNPNAGPDILFFRSPDGGLWTATTPVALGQLDRVSGYVIYPTVVP